MQLQDSYEIEITPLMIKLGHKRSAYGCPINMGIRKAVGSLSYKIVTGLRMVFISDDHQIMGIYILPLEAQDFIKSFDSDKPVQPISFTITRKVSAPSCTI